MKSFPPLYSLLYTIAPVSSDLCLEFDDSVTILVVVIRVTAAVAGDLMPTIRDASSQCDVTLTLTTCRCFMTYPKEASSSNVYNAEYATRRVSMLAH